ncbi:RNA polymerase sigma factor [Kitasatospora herbaricolor]|uniref:RNA polymerase sigma factor n=1 Tax=Kitasatospora herbaricolor TaxID=68217 RepID=UPI0036DC2D34
MDTAGFDEADAWSKARDGDSASFAALFDRHRDRVFGQALRLLGAPHDAEDVTAMVFLEAWRRRDAVRVVDGSIIAWLLVTTNYTIRNHTRSARRYRIALSKLPTPEPQPDGTPEVDDAFDNDGRARVVRQAFAALAPHDQDVVTLCILEELPLAEAAAVLRIPVGTVKSRLSRAKRRLGDLALAQLEPALEGGAE